MIHTRALTRKFRVKKETVEAVKGVDIDVAPGELVAFLGPNGAGKSTTLRILTTLLRPSSGTATVSGHDVVNDPIAARSRIGYIGQGNSAGHAHKVRDELIDQGGFYGLPRDAAKRRADELLEAMNLSELGKRTGATLSGGQKRRLDIALGMVHHPSLLFLDEPSTGLDPQNRANLAEQIRKLRAETGMTIFLTTHYLDEADQLAERVLIIDDGKVIADGSPTELKTTLAGDQIRLGFATSELAARARFVIEHVPTAREVTLDGNGLSFTVADAHQALPTVMRELDAREVPARSAGASVPTLDDVFLSLTGRTLRDADTEQGAES